MSNNRISPGPLTSSQSESPTLSTEKTSLSGSSSGDPAPTPPARESPYTTLCRLLTGTGHCLQKIKHVLRDVFVQYPFLFMMALGMALGAPEKHTWSDRAGRALVGVVIFLLLIYLFCVVVLLMPIVLPYHACRWVMRKLWPSETTTLPRWAEGNEV